VRLIEDSDRILDAEEKHQPPWTVSPMGPLGICPRCEMWVRTRQSSATAARLGTIGLHGGRVVPIWKFWRWWRKYRLEVKARSGEILIRWVRKDEDDG